MPRPPANIIVPLRLSAPTAAKLAAMLKRIGYTRLSAISRLVEWYAAQPDDIRSALKKNQDQLLKELKPILNEEQMKKVQQTLERSPARFGFGTAGGGTCTSGKCHVKLTHRVVFMFSAGKRLCAPATSWTRPACFNQT